MKKIKNNMEHNLDLKFKKLRENIKLKEGEKSFHRNEILKFMETHESKPSPTLSHFYSPFQFNIFSKAHFFIASFAFFIFFATGLVSSAKASLPNQYLYVFKINVLEPVQIFMTWNSKEKNDTRIAFIGQRLQDFNKVSLSQKISAEEKAVFADSFSLKIKEVQEEITKLAEKEKVSDALSSANELQSVLSAHSVVLDKIHESELRDEKVVELKTIMTPDALAINIDEGIGTTEEIIGNLTSKLQSTEESEELGKTILKQKEELQASLLEIKFSVEKALKDTPKSIDFEDQDYINKKISEIENLLIDGETSTKIDNKKETLNLYNEAGQKIGELKTLLGSGQELGIDVLGESEVEGEVKLINSIETAE